MSLDQRYKVCHDTLSARGQAHVLRWWNELRPAQRDHLLTEIESIPWDVVDPLIATHVEARPTVETPKDLSPPEVYPGQPGPDQEDLYRKASETGRELLAAGKVAAFTVAGGQGTRLGFDGPKGVLPITPVRGKTLFQLFGETVRAAGQRYGTTVPWYLMTSPDNHEPTTYFFESHDYFGLSPADVMTFPQAVLPVFDFSGRMMLAEKHQLCLAPDGHGGSLKALVQSGALRDMQARGIEIISYFQVDNPLVKPFDPLFIGLHALTGSEMATKVTPKADDLERVGNVCQHQGKTVVIEYTDFPEELARERNDDGSRRFDAANLAVHLLNVSFVDRIIAQESRLPYRRAEKPVAYVDESGESKESTTPNSVKLETFVFDALPLAASPMLLEVDRAQEFSPVKNATGVDSVATAIRDQVRRAARWLESAGVAVPRKPDGEPDATLEIAPCFALEREQLAARATDLPSIRSGDTCCIE